MGGPHHVFSNNSVEVVNVVWNNGQWHEVERQFCDCGAMRSTADRPIAPSVLTLCYPEFVNKLMERLTHGPSILWEFTPYWIPDSRNTGNGTIVIAVYDECQVPQHILVICRVSESQLQVAADSEIDRVYTFVQEWGENGGGHLCKGCD